MLDFVNLRCKKLCLFINSSDLPYKKVLKLNNFFTVYLMLYMYIFECIKSLNQVLSFKNNTEKKESKVFYNKI